MFISQTTDFHFANYRDSFRKLQILISQTTDFHFANYRFPFRFVPFRFANYSKPFSSCFCTRISLIKTVGEPASRTSQTWSLQSKQLKRSSDETINNSIITNLISVTIICSSDEQCKIQINTQLKTRILILEYCSLPVPRVRI